MMMERTVDTCLYCDDCLNVLKNFSHQPTLTFFDPPFNVGKKYYMHNDNMPDEEYWAWMSEILSLIRKHTLPGGSIYFMQREKNAHKVIETLLKTGWTFKNMIIWKKMTSATPMTTGFGKSYQVIVYATKGEKPRVFNRLRIDPELKPHQKVARKNGIFVTDVWDDIREMTSGYFAGAEQLKNENGKMAHHQQSPIALLVRIILSSSMPGDVVFDPFSGTGTTVVAARQLRRIGVGVECDPHYMELIQKRLADQRDCDRVDQYRADYKHTPNLEKIWGD